MRYKQGELVILPFPFSDQSGKKIRPALIVSNEEFNKKCGDYLILPVTSVLKDVSFSVNLFQKDLEEGKLVVDSRLRIDKLTCVDKKLILKKIGKINNDYQNKILNQLRLCF